MPRESRVPSSAVPQTRREARQRQRQIERLAEQRAGFEDVDKQQDLEFEGGEFVPDEQAVEQAEQNVAEKTASQLDFVEPGDINVGINQNTLAADQQLTDEGTTEAEQRLAEQTAADQEFVRPGDLQADIDPETFAAEATLTEQGQQRAQQRQAEQLRSEAASQSNRFGESDFTVDRSGDEITVEPTQSAINRERREQASQQFESDSQFLTSVDPSEVKLSGDQARLSDAALSRAKQRAEAAEQRQRSKAIGKQKREFAEKLRSGTATDGIALSGATAADVVVDDGKLRPDQQLRNQLDQQATQQQKQQVASELSSGDGLDIPQSDIPQIDPSDIVVEDGKLRPDQQLRNQLDQQATQQQKQQVASELSSGDGLDIPQSDIPQIDPSDIVVDDGQLRPDEQTQNQIARAAFADDLESGEAFPTSVDNPEAVLSNVDPSDITIDSDGDPKPSESIQSQIDSVVQSRSTQEAKEDFAARLEAGDTFIDEGTDGELTTTPEEARNILQNVDASDIEQTEDGSLTPDDEIQAQIAEFQIRSQVGDAPNLNTDNVLQRAVSQDAILQAAEEQIENQSPRIADANLRVESDGTITADRLQLNSRRFDGFRDVEAIPDDALGDVDLSVDATEQFRGQVEKSIAEQISDRNVVDVSPGQIDISGGNVSTQTPESLTIEADEIGSDGLTESGQADFARRQLQSIETSEGVSVDTPINSQPFANVSADLARAAEGGGSLSSATRIVAASETVDNVGDLDDLPDSQIIAGLDPQQADQRLNIDASTVREAQSDIQQRRQQLNNDPQQVLESIADNQDEFINDSTRIGMAGERGQRIRSAARSQLNDLEANIAAADPEVDPRDVDISLTDDLSGIRSINREGRQAVAQRVDDQLANFDSSEINVGVSGGQITTSIEDSVRERFVENAQRVQEIQVRNQIADETEGIDRREINVDDGTVSLSDEGLNQLRIDAVDGETGDGEIVNDLNAQTQGVDLDVGDVRLQQTSAGGVSVGLSEFGRTQLNTDRPSIDEMLSRSTAAGGFEGQGQVVEPAADPEENFGDAVPDSIEDTTRQLAQETRQVVDGAAGFVGDAFRPAGTAVENTLIGLQDITGGDVSAIQSNARAANQTVTNAAEGVTSGLLFPVRAAGSAPQLGVEVTEFGIEAASDPVETAEKIPGAIGTRVDQSITGLQQNPVQTSAELAGSFVSSAGVFRAAQGTKAGPAVRATMQPGEELFKVAGRRGITGTRRVANIISNPNFVSEDRGQTSPLLGLEARSESDSGGLFDDLEDDLNNVESTSPEVGEGQTSFRPEFDRESDIDAGDPIERRVEVRQRGVDDRSRDEAFRRSLDDEPTAADIDADVGSDLLAGGIGSTIDAIEPQVDADDSVQSPEVTADATTVGAVGTDLGGVDSQFEQGIGETGQRRFFERSEPNVQGGQAGSVGVTPRFETGFDVRPEPRGRTEPGFETEPRGRTEPGFETEPRTGLETGTETGQEPRQETRTGFKTETRTETGIETAFESEPRIENEAGFETTFEPGREVDSDPPREPNADREEREQRRGGLDSEVAEFDFLSLDETDDRIEDVLGGV